MHTYTEHEIEQQLSALGDSASLIDAIIAGGDTDEEQREIMDRNVRHIHIMCDMPHLFKRDLKPFAEAAARGTAWLSESGAVTA